VLVEVKSKIAGQRLGGMENVTSAKQSKLRTLGAMYLQRYGGDHNSVRFDVIEIEFTDASLSRHVVRHIPDAFRG
jgi:Holliday junction resolvase-like predicted endonuclease